MEKATSILVVEDEMIVAMSISSVLEDYGYEITGMVSSAEEAIDAAKIQPPDVALMDINLAGSLDGIEAAKVMMAECGVLIVYVTAQMDKETRERALSVGPAGFLTKPFTPEELADAVAAALTRRPA